MTKPFLFELAALKAAIESLHVEQSPQFYVAFSGGVDSQVLLHHLYRFKSERDPHLSVTAIHINHHLNENSTAWRLACEKQCADWQIPCHTVNIEVEDKNIESDAREKRYKALAHWIKAPHDILLTGHHEQDQVETFFLQMMRGSGIDGLSAIPHIHRFNQGLKARPLLMTPKKDILKYAKDHGLSWIEDPSNNDNYFSRNHIRNKILPALNQKWPCHQASIARSIAHIQNAKMLLDSYAKEDLLKCIDNTQRLNIHPMQSWSSARIQLVLREWINQHQQVPPGAKRLHQLYQLIQARPKQQPEISCTTYCIRRYRDHLYLLKSMPRAHDEPSPIIWEHIHKHLTLPGLNQALAISPVKHGLRSPKDHEKVSVRFKPKHQHAFKPAGSLHHRKIKHLFQAWGIPPWERKYVPCIYYNECLVAIVPYAIAHDFLTCQQKDKPIAFGLKEAPDHIKT